MCVSLDELELLDNVLMFLNGYNTPEYSWVKATTVSVRLRILFVILQNTNKLSGTIAGERQLHYLQTQFVLVFFFIFLDSASTPATHGAAILSKALYPKGRVL